MTKRRKDSKGNILFKGESELKNKGYIYRYTENGKRQHIFATTLNDLRAKIQIYNNGKLQHLQSVDKMVEIFQEENITFLEILDLCLKEKERLTYNTYQSYKKAYDILLRNKIVKMPAKNIRVLDAKKYIYGLDSQGFSASMIRIIKIFCSNAYNTAIENELNIGDRNPFNFRLKTSTLSRPPERKIIWTAKEEESFLAFCKEENIDLYYIVIFLLNTGLRIGEFAALTKQDIDLENRSITIDKQSIRIFNATKGHGDKMTQRISKTKTQTGVRTIPLNDKATEAIQHIMANKRKKYLWYVQLNLAGWLRNIQEKHNKKVFHIKPRINPHYLRHMFCSNLVTAGLEVHIVQYLMGHKDAKTTLGVYTHVRKEDVAKKLKILNW